MSTNVLLLSVNYEFVKMIDVQKAINLLWRKKVEVVKFSEKELAAGVKAPKVLRLLKAIRQHYGKEVYWTRQNMFIRDGFTCQYCQEKFPAAMLTVDHVFPECMGGKKTWENTVTACKPCNNVKDNRTPEQARMYLKKRPVQPTIMEFTRRRAHVEGIDKMMIALGIFN